MPLLLPRQKSRNAATSTAAAAHVLQLPLLLPFLLLLLLFQPHPPMVFAHNHVSGGVRRTRSSPAVVRRPIGPESEEDLNEKEEDVRNATTRDGTRRVSEKEEEEESKISQFLPILKLPSRTFDPERTNPKDVDFICRSKLDRAAISAVVEAFALPSDEHGSLVLPPATPAKQNTDDDDNHPFPVPIPAIPRNDALWWKPDSSSSTCHGCGSAFGFFWPRRHHCRSCGGLFCHACTQNRVYFAGNGDDAVKERICGGCVEGIKKFDWYKEKFRELAGKIVEPPRPAREREEAPSTKMDEDDDDYLDDEITISGETVKKLIQEALQAHLLIQNPARAKYVVHFAQYYADLNKWVRPMRVKKFGNLLASHVDMKEDFDSKFLAICRKGRAFRRQCYDIKQRAKHDQKKYENKLNLVRNRLGLLSRLAWANLIELRTIIDDAFAHYRKPPSSRVGKKQQSIEKEVMPVQEAVMSDIIAMMYQYTAKHELECKDFRRLMRFAYVNEKRFEKADGMPSVLYELAKPRLKTGCLKETFVDTNGNLYNLILAEKRNMLEQTNSSSRKSKLYDF